MSGGTGLDIGVERARANDGLNPSRHRGFGARRIETPTLNDMRVRQGAVVGKENSKLLAFERDKGYLCIPIEG